MNKRIKNALEISTCQIISQRLTIPTYSWLNSNNVRNLYQMA